MKRTVYIIEDVHGKNFLPAKEFGDLRVILSGKESIEHSQEKLHRIITEEMKPTDFLLLVGSPLHISMAAYYAGHQFGLINFLVWDRDHYRYTCNTVNL